jgi:hypothetical protein
VGPHERAKLQVVSHLVADIGGVKCLAIAGAQRVVTVSVTEVDEVIAGVVKDDARIRRIANKGTI